MESVSPAILGLLAFVAFFGFAALGVPLAFAFAIVGVFGLVLLVGWGPASRTLVLTFWRMGNSYALMAIPLFALMGHFASESGIGAELYHAASKWLGRLPGGLAVATTWGAAGFAACTGSSTASVMTFVPISYKPMAQRGYDRPLIAGTIVAGATMGTLIPPALGFIIVGTLTDESIGQLFMAGVFPGILEAITYTVVIVLLVVTGKRIGPRTESASWSERLRSLKGVWGMLVLVGLVLGGIGMGVFTPTEGAAMGAAGALVIQMVRGKLTRRSIVATFKSTVVVSCMAYTVLMGSMVFARFLSVSGAVGWLVDSLLGLGLPSMSLLALCLFALVPLGCVMPATPMMVLAVPLLYPLFVIELGFSGIWFCVLMVMMMELAVITPPVGMNLFVAKSMLPHFTDRDLYSGVLPFVMGDFVRIAIVVAFPIIATWLPSKLF